MEILQHLESRDAFGTKMDEAYKALQELSSKIIELRQPQNGPHLLFHHLTTTMQRTAELKTIVRRLYDNRVALMQSDFLEHSIGMMGRESPFPPALQELMKVGNDLDSQIKLDFQTMLLFTGIALDDWAHLAGYILAVKRPTKSSFDAIVTDETKGVYALLWAEHRADILWLDAFPRLYRNKMIVHQEQPWQISHSRSLYMLDWTFWTPIAAGWATEESVEAAHQSLLKIAGHAKASPDTGIHQTIYQLLNRISDFPEDQRRAIIRTAVEFGFQTPSFQEFAHRLADFLIAATQTLYEHVVTNPEAITLGSPIRT